MPGVAVEGREHTGKGGHTGQGAVDACSEEGRRGRMASDPGHSRGVGMGDMHTANPGLCLAHSLGCAGSVANAPMAAAQRTPQTLGTWGSLVHKKRKQAEHEQVAVYDRST